LQGGTEERGPTLGAGQKKHLSPAEENVPSVLKLISCVRCPWDASEHILNPADLRYPSWHPDNIKSSLKQPKKQTENSYF